MISNSGMVDWKVGNWKHQLVNLFPRRDDNTCTLQTEPLGYAEADSQGGSRHNDHLTFKSHAKFDPLH